MLRTHTEPRMVNFFERKPSRTSFFAYHPYTNAWVNIEPSDFDGYNLPKPKEVIRKIPFKTLFDALETHWGKMNYTIFANMVKHMVKINQIGTGKAIFPIYHKQNPTDNDYIEECLKFPPVVHWITDPRTNRQIELKWFAVYRLTGKSCEQLVYHTAIKDEVRKRVFALYDDNKHTYWGMLFAISRIDPNSVLDAIFSCMENQKQETCETIPSDEKPQ